MSIGSFRDWLADIGSYARPSEQDAESIVFEDQDGERIKFNEFFCGKPSIVAFFYTRCTNPLKCSLTITKFARLQKLVADRRLDGQIRTAAITYDHQFDRAERMRGYGSSRGVHMDADNRLLRTVEGLKPLRKYFRLGVNFIQSLVNRHRVEIYILDEAGRIAASFERIQWDESEVLDRAAALLARDNASTAVQNSSSGGNENGFGKNSNTATTSYGTAIRRSASASRPAPWLTSPALPATLSILSLAAAFFPKCPVCWAAYLSVFGIAGLERLPYSPWLLPLLASLMLINLGSLWLQQRLQQGTAGFYLAAMGAFLIFVLGIGFELEYASAAGVVFTTIGSAFSVLGSRPATNFKRSQVSQIFPGS
jgi:protein SCO1/2